jgi:hypothetical protein
MLDSRKILSIPEIGCLQKNKKGNQNKDKTVFLIFNLEACVLILAPSIQNPVSSIQHPEYLSQSD